MRNGRQEKKEGKRELQKFEYRENERSLTGEIVSLLIIFEKISSDGILKNGRHKLQDMELFDSHFDI